MQPAKGLPVGELVVVDEVEVEVVELVLVVEVVEVDVDEVVLVVEVVEVVEVFVDDVVVVEWLEVVEVEVDVVEVFAIELGLEWMCEKHTRRFRVFATYTHW